MRRARASRTLCIAHVAPPSKKSSGERSPKKLVGTNEIARLVIITKYFPSKNKSLLEYPYPFEQVWRKMLWTLLGDTVAKCARTQEIQLGSPDCFSSREGGVWGRDYWICHGRQTMLNSVWVSWALTTQKVQTDGFSSHCILSLTNTSCLRHKFHTGNTIPSVLGLTETKLDHTGGQSSVKGTKRFGVLSK